MRCFSTVKLTFLCGHEIEVWITQSTFEEINIEVRIWLAVFATVIEEFIVIIGEIEILIIVTSTRQR